MMQKIMMIVSVFLLVAGCKQSSSHEYLLTHPNVLEKEVSRCQLGNQDASYCERINEIAREFISFANLAQQNPEGFGKQIMQAQAEMVNKQQIVEELQKKIQNAKNSTSDAAPLQQQLAQAQADYKKQVMKVNLLLAVIAAANQPSN